MDRAEQIAVDLMLTGRDSKELESVNFHDLKLGAWTVQNLASRIRQHLNNELDEGMKQVISQKEKSLLVKTVPAKTVDKPVDANKADVSKSVKSVLTAKENVKHG